MMTKVSVVIPVYSRSGDLTFLQEAIQSVLAQDYDGCSIIVVDDGSPAPVRPVVEHFSDTRIRYFRQENLGPAVARNKGILESDAPYIAFLDSDDIWLPCKINEQVELLDNRPDAVGAITDFCIGDQPDELSRLSEFSVDLHNEQFRSLLRQNFICTSTVVVRKGSLAYTGLFDPGLWGPEDLDLWLRLAIIGKFEVVPRVRVFKRRHEQNISSTPRFYRHKIVFYESWLFRCRSQPELLPSIRQQLRDCWEALAYAERDAGAMNAARRAYLRCVRLGKNPFGSLVRAAFLTLPEWSRGWIDSQRKI